MKALSILVLAFALVVTGCAGSNNKEKKGTVRVATGDSGIIPGNGNPATGPGTTFQALWGSITPSGSMETLASDILRASGDQGELRPPVQGFAFAGDIYVTETNDVRGAVGGIYNINNQSRFRLDICDGVSQEQGCLQLGFSSATSPSTRISGQISNGGSAQVVMTDEFRVIKLDGSYNSNEYSGTIKYCNGSSCQNPQSFISLGTFRVPTCGFFHCGN